MSVHFLRQIDKLKRQILTLGELVQDAVDDAIVAVSNRDPELAAKVLRAEEQIDDMEVDVEEECLHTLALHQPVAFDLRYVVSVLKINSDLERVSDLAKNIAQQAILLSKEERLVEMPFDLPHMARLVKAMLRDALKAMVNVDMVLAQKVIDADDAVDDMHEAVYDIIFTKLREMPQFTEQLIHLMSISRQLERIADHAVNIAEDVLYTSGGEIVRHRKNRPAQQPASETR
jgi:phosphate transport system protein